MTWIRLRLSQGNILPEGGVTLDSTPKEGEPAPHVSSVIVLFLRPEDNNDTAAPESSPTADLVPEAHKHI